MSGDRLLWGRSKRILGASIPGLEEAMKQPLMPATADALAEMMKEGLGQQLEKFKGKPLNTDEVTGALAEAFKLGSLFAKTKSRRPEASFITPDRTGCWS